jgi:hypothetical protein
MLLHRHYDPTFLTAAMLLHHYDNPRSHGQLTFLTRKAKLLYFWFHPKVTQSVKCQTLGVGWGFPGTAMIA